MAGHSKWANIQFRKSNQDKKRGKIFTKLIREITVAARMGGENVSSNARLRDAIDKALKANMKRDTINNAVKRGVGALEGSNYEEIRYEGYGPAGVAIIVDCMTDNRNRTVSEVRHAFTKHGGNLGTDGSVAYLFQKRGQLTYGPGANEELILNLALEAGADDVVTYDDGSIEVITKPESFSSVKNAMETGGASPDEAEILMHPMTQVTLDLEHAETLQKITDVLEDLDDVQNVYTNADISEEIMEALQE